MIEKLARAAFAKLCPWIAKEYPEFPVDKSTTMKAYIEGYEQGKLDELKRLPNRSHLVAYSYMNGQKDSGVQIKLGHRQYDYKHTSRKTLFVTINGHQVGAGYNFMREIALAHEYIKRGEWPPSVFPFEELYPESKP